MATMEVEEPGMPRGMQHSESKGKGTEVPRGDPIRPVDPFGESFYDRPGRSGGGGGGGPNPGTGTDPAVYLPTPSKKRHIQKPENFTDPKDWDKFKRQEFLYYEEYRDDFIDDTARIQFDLSFFTGGLPEKFMANFVDQ
jgi:hypothetical protein